MWNFNLGGFGQFDRSVGQFGRGNILVNFNAVSFQAGEKSIQLFGRMFFGREHAIYFIREQISTFLTDGDKVADLVVFFLGHKHEGFLPQATARTALIFFRCTAAPKHDHRTPPG